MPRQSAAVYRRRRLLVLVLIIVLVAAVGGGVWMAFAQPWKASTPASTGSAPTSSGTPGSGAPSPDPTGSGEPVASPADSPSPDPSETPGIVACRKSDVEVTAITDADTYPAGKLPQLSIQLTSKSAVDCTLDVGSSTQEFRVTSGKDQWWHSTDCQTDPSSMIVTLKAGTTVRSATPVTWDRTRSSVASCGEKHRARAPGGGASYHVSVSIGGFASVASKQIILR